MSNVNFCIGDITTADVDCIVNAANNTLLGGGGVDGAIHQKAGPELYKECKKLHGCKTGEAKITKGYNLKAKRIIHTVGPIYHNMDNDSTTLAACYIKSLNLARENGLHSIMFPAISTGVYGFPLKEATIIAMKTTARWLEINPDYNMHISLCFYKDQPIQFVSKKELEEYLHIVL